MAWPEHPFASALLVVRTPAERAGALSAIACFKEQNWPAKQLVLVNATRNRLILKADRLIKELLVKTDKLAVLNAVALAAAEGEWCFPWFSDCWYASDYFAAHLTDLKSSKAPGLICDPFIENGVLATTTIENAPFYCFFRCASGPDYGKAGSSFDFLKQLGKPRIISQIKPLAKRLVTPDQLAQLALKKPEGKVKDAVCLVQLGRYGDLINMLPIALHIHNTYGKPYVMISRDFADLLEGVSYVHSYPVDLKDNQIHEALALARTAFKRVIQTQIWGQNYVQDKQTEAFNHESWRIAGFSKQFYDLAWRPLFDRENLERAHAATDWLLDGRPFILTNMTQSASSPFKAGEAVLNLFESQFGKQYQTVDIGGLKLAYIYDLLPLIRRASAVVSIDTSLLHLAAATNTPVVAVLNPEPWLGTACRCQAVKGYSYSEVAAAPECLLESVWQALSMVRKQLPNPMLPQAAPERQIFHVVAPYEAKLPAERRRKQWAVNSWKVLYARGVIPLHFTRYSRWGTHKDSVSQLPYLKDVLKVAMDRADWDDIICYTNDDIIIHPDLPNELRFYCSVYGAVILRRCEIGLAPPPDLNETPAAWAQAAQNDLFNHEGRDTAAFTKRWLTVKWDQLPDFLIGATDWDNCFALMIRAEASCSLKAKSLQGLAWPAEMPLGWISHIRHCSPWHNPVNYLASPANVYNRKVFRNWAEVHMPHLRFTEDNQITHADT